MLSHVPILTSHIVVKDLIIRGGENIVSLALYIGTELGANLLHSPP